MVTCDEKCPSVIALTRTNFFLFRMHHGTPRPTRNRSLTVSRPFQRCRPRPPLVRIFFPSPAPTSTRRVLAPCHPSAPVFALRSAFIAAFSTFARTLSPTLSFSEPVVTNCTCAVVKHDGNFKNPSSNSGKSNGAPGAALVYVKCGYTVCQFSHESGVTPPRSHVSHLKGVTVACVCLAVERVVKTDRGRDRCWLCMRNEWRS